MDFKQLLQKMDALGGKQQLNEGSKEDYDYYFGKDKPDSGGSKTKELSKHTATKTARGTQYTKRDLPGQDTSKDADTKTAERRAKKQASEDIADLIRSLNAIAESKDEVEEEKTKEGNEFTGALAKAKEEGKKEFEVDGKKYQVKESNVQDDKMSDSQSQLQDLEECYGTAMMTDQSEQESGMNINASTDTRTGSKSLTVTAQGEAAEHLAQLLKLSGIGGAHTAGHEAEMEEAYVNEPDPEVQGIETQLAQGNDLNRPKNSYPKVSGGDNPMNMREAQELAALEQQLTEALAEFKISRDVAEGYILKKTNVSKYMKPGDPDEYTQDVNVKDTDYEIINNKTGQVVGTASWTTNDFFGPGALKITMKNGATRWLDIWEREKGNPQSAFNRFVKDPKTAKKYKDEQGVAEAAKWRDPKYKDKLYTQEPGDSDDYDNIGYGYDFPERPENDPGQKRRMGGVGSEFDHNDPLKKGRGIGRSGIKHSLNLAGKRKGLPSRDQITSLKGSIKDAHGKHRKPNLPEQGVAEAKNRDGDRKEPMKKALADKKAAPKKKVAETVVAEKAKSQQQQKFMGMVHAMQKGERIKGASPELKKVARSMSQKDVRDYAATKHKGLPKKVGESESFKKKVTNQ